MNKILILKDNINTDDIIPTTRCTNLSVEKLGEYCFEHIISRDKLKEYDSIRAGDNFGCGSSRENASIALLGAGIKKIIANSFAEIFYRNAINTGLDIRLSNETQTNIPILRDIISSGGLINFILYKKIDKFKEKKLMNVKRSMTIAEKILSQSSNTFYLKPGDVVFARPDLIMSHDAVVAPAVVLFNKHFINTKVYDPNNFIFVADHFIQIPQIRKGSKSQKFYEIMCSFAKEHKIPIIDKVSDYEAEGICHIVLPERGLISSNNFIVGTDSHTCTYGALGTFSVGIGTTDLVGILASGEIWMRVPKTHKYIFEGELPKGTYAKDLILFLLKKIGSGGAIGRVIEFYGDTIDSLSLDEKLTLSNMTVETGAICGIIPGKIKADCDAEYEVIKYFNVSKLQPQIAQPYSPDNVVNIEDLLNIKIDVAYIGSCTGGKLEDIRIAATILNGKKIDRYVRMYVVPATQNIRKKAEKKGYLNILQNAGAEILEVGCGACINAGKGTLEKDEVGIYSINRNFKGRSGHPDSKVYLASPAVVASSALFGRINFHN